ncbi:Rieske (2Fe-2S) protein [Zavarzinia aquatilis]|uniref:Rieske (2Fe-2S) protein n=1 Tax=Zavarzinia aquatilis TaxID=2211142 RepID=UPI001402ADFF|nr:Rieske (2Fe-2S) protein [Zavarzinia aquatilis]
MSYHPVASSRDLAGRHVFQACLLGQDIALWRADDGTVNAWENRCPHRGVRLSLGVNLGDRLMCRYHGWRYDSGSGACSHIPAHPEGPIPATLCARRFPVIEAGGLVFVALGDDTAALPTLPETAIPLRALPVGRPAEAIAAALAGAGLAAAGPLHFAETQGGATVHLLIQPASGTTCVIHGLADMSAEALPLQRHMSRLMESRRRAWEARP